jgi:hypothetical protein
MYRKNKNPFQKEKGQTGTHLDDADRRLLRRYRIEIHRDMSSAIRAGRLPPASTTLAGSGIRSIRAQRLGADLRCGRPEATLDCDFTR